MAQGNPNGRDNSIKDKTDIRIKLVADEILKGLSRGRIIEKFREPWELTEAMIDRYIGAAYRYIKENVKDDLENIKETNVNRLLEIYNDSYNSGDRASMFKALDMINRLSGLYEDKQKLEIKLADFKFGFADDEDNDEVEE